MPELLARGYQVRAMVRAASPVYGIRWPAAEIVVADALDPESMKTAMQDVLHQPYRRRLLPQLDAAIAALDNDQFPMPGRRRETLRALCQSCSGHEDDLVMETVAGLKGVGPWTMAMLAMRGDGQPDNFPNKDLALERAWSRLSTGSIDLQEQSARWRPWRCYAANLLWRSLST